ncbi:MAG: hypothetical protein WCF96_09555 [Eubacteriales bacterium]
MSRKPSDWKVKFDELKLLIPKGISAKTFGKCRNEDKTWNKDEIAKVCVEKKIKDKTDAVFAYLTHKDAKIKGTAKKRKAKTPEAQEQVAFDLFSKKTYKELSVLQKIDLVEFIKTIIKDEADTAIAELNSNRDDIDKKLKVLSEITGK